MTEEQQQLIWQYCNELTDKLDKIARKVNLLDKELEAQQTIKIKMTGEEYIEYIQTRTYLNTQEIEYLKKKYKVV